eukprot:UN01396
MYCNTILVARNNSSSTQLNKNSTFHHQYMHSQLLTLQLYQIFVAKMGRILECTSSINCNNNIIEHFTAMLQYFTV